MSFIHELWYYMLISAPYILLGLIVSGLVHAFLSKQVITKLLGKDSKYGAIKASILGVPLPLCSCAVVPTAVTLKENGADNASTSAFLISTPQTGIDSIALTYGMIDTPMTIIRPVMAFISSWTAGIFQKLFNMDGGSSTVQAKCSCSCGKDHSDRIDQRLHIRVVRGMRYAFGNLIDDMSSWMAVGIILGALISWIVPDDLFAGVGGILGRFIVMGIGIPLYVCASASTPIAASLMLKGISPGTAFLFLTLGPATNISNLMVIQKYIGKKGVLINVLTITGVSLIASFIIDWLYGFFNWGAKGVHIHQHMEHSGVLEITSAIVLSFLLFRGIWRRQLASLLRKK